MNTLKTKLILLIALCMFMAGASWAGSEVKQSGFLESYPVFEADKDRKGALIYKKPGVALEKYTKIFLDPAEIWIAADSKYKGIKPDELKTLADTFRAALVSALEPAYPVVSNVGPDVLRIRLAITNVKMKKKKKSLLSFTPIGLAVTGIQAASGANIILSDATIEMELLDPQSNERLGVLIDRASDSVGKKGKKKKKTSWGDVEKTLKFYAERFRGSMDEIHAK
jgi:hypothetical protein